MQYLTIWLIYLFTMGGNQLSFMQSGPIEIKELNLVMLINFNGPTLSQT